MEVVVEEESMTTCPQCLAGVVSQVLILYNNYLFFEKLEWKNLFIKFLHGMVITSANLFALKNEKMI